MSEEPKREYRALCQYRGMLVIMLVKKSSEGKKGRCYDCRESQFWNDNGWVRCTNCGFAILDTDYARIITGQRVRVTGDE